MSFKKKNNLTKTIENYSQSLELNKNFYLNILKYKKDGIFIISTKKTFKFDLDKFSQNMFYKELAISQLIYYINFFEYYGNIKPHIHKVKIVKNKKKLKKKNILMIFFKAQIIVNYQYFLQFFLFNNYQKVVNSIYNTKIGMRVSFSKESKNILIIKLFNLHYIFPFFVNNFDFDLQFSEIVFNIYGNESHLWFLFSQLVKFST